MGEAISSVCFFGVGFVWLSYGFEYFAAAQFWSASGMFICAFFSFAACIRYVIHNVLFKLNTVVNTYNKKVDMSEEINRIKPSRWKIFQALPIEGENAGKEALRQVEPFLITSDEFDAFIDRHKKVIDRPDVIVPESNTKMQNSYLVRAQHQHARN